MSSGPNNPVLYETTGEGVALITFNRPDRLNAWTIELAEAYEACLTTAADDPEVRVVVVTGAGRAFCAGADLSPGGVASGTPAARRTPHLAALIPKLVIAAINGPCAGAGFVQAALCDVRFAAAGAKFTTAFARRGMIAEFGLSWVLPRLVGMARASDLLLSGRVVLADEAERLGFVNAVHKPDELMARSLAYASEAARHCAPRSVAAMKRQLLVDQSGDLDGAVAASIALMAEFRDHPDRSEGASSFLDKRAPHFSPLPPAGTAEPTC